MCLKLQGYDICENAFMNFTKNVYSEPCEKPSNSKLLDAHWHPLLGATLVHPTLDKLPRSAVNKPWRYIWV
jgi:hypothetical protein